MRNITKKVTALVLSALFASSQITFAQTVVDGNTGLGQNLGGAVLDSYEGGFTGMTKGQNSADLNFNGSAHLHWGSLNVDRNESLNFKAADGVSGLTVLNSVTGGMSQIYGNITSNEGIAKLIISNPNGMLFDGATFTTAGDVMITTQPMTATFSDGGVMSVQNLSQPAAKMVTIKDSTMNAGGEFNILAPSINMVQTNVTAGNGVKLITANGQDYLAAGSINDGTAVRLEAVQINGNVEIISDKGVVKTVNGGKIDGDLTVKSDDSVSLNYVSDGKVLEVTGNVNAKANGTLMYARNVKVGGNLDMTNGGGFLEAGNVDVKGNMNLKTVKESENKEGYKHFVHVVGENKVGGNLNVDSENNIHIGGYNFDEKQHLQGSLTVQGDINAHAHNGHVAVTVNTTADKVNLTSDNLNVLSDGKAVITANEYQFKSNGYVGGISNSENFVDTMENYRYIPAGGFDTTLNIAGGNITKLETKQAKIHSAGDMTVNGVNAEDVYLASGKDITIKDDVHANEIVVGGETDRLKVEFTDRDYRLKFTDIRDGEEATLEGSTEITYEMTDGEGGYNTPAAGERGDNTTYLVGPDRVIPEPQVEPEPILPEDGDNVKLLPNADRDLLAKTIDQGEVYTPVAYAADLEDENDKGVRKNVDGSVTVVRAYPMGK